jgi:Fur family peroxide stress response transcriptional regulator
MQPDHEARCEELISQLRHSGHRITPQRLAILRVLAASDGHPSAEAIYTQVVRDFPTTSLATVYKTIAVLKEMGQVLELGFSNDDNRYDGNRPYPHPHLICIRCRKITDPEVRLVGDLTQEVAQQTGYRVINHRLDFYGLCPDCQQDAEKLGAEA